MKCPLTIIAFAKGETVVRSGLMDCLQAECAWWDKTAPMCSICKISDTLVYLNNNLANIANLMPRGGAR